MSKYKLQRDISNDLKLDVLMSVIMGAWFLVMIGLLIQTPTRIETVTHNMALRRLQDGQFDECELTLRELTKIEESLSKSLAAHYHGRIAYPRPVDVPDDLQQADKAEAGG